MTLIALTHYFHNKMKITFGGDAIKKIPIDAVRVHFVESSTVPFLEHNDGRRELNIKTGKYSAVTQRSFILLCRKVVRLAQEHKINRVAILFDREPFSQLKSLSDFEVASLMVQNFEMANFEFTTFRTKPKSGWPKVKEVIIYGEVDAHVKAGFKKGQVIGEYVNKCRELANAPGGDMTPTALAEEAKKTARGTKIKVTALGPKELKKLKMGAILGVARGSKEEPCFIIMEYNGGGKEKPIVLIGKGVTFDTGGLSLKPSDSMVGMHLDMSGGAAVINTIALAAKLGVKKNIIGLVPAVENMPGGESYRPGDVLVSMSGKTIEVLNTDAEGRVILADALTYARKYNPRLVVDVATLTGAALIALGQRTSAFMTKEKKFEDLFVKLGEESGDYMWPLPLWDEYEEEVRGSRGDVTNTHNKNSRYGGSINGGIFLHEFARGLPWVHIDIAPRMEAIPSDNLAPGAAGEPVRFLLKLVENF